MTKPSQSKRRGEQAIEAFQEADRIAARPRVAWGDDIVFKRDAEHAAARAAELNEPAGMVVEGMGEAVAWQPDSDTPDRTVETLVGTLQQGPSSISVGATERRLNAAVSVGVLEPAVDAAQAVGASNPIEKMLAHQLAAAHFEAMRLLAASQNPRLPPADAIRYINAATRLMDVFQTGCLTLQKLKTKGQQRVVVQYQQVNVTEGGQAVVTGTVAGGSRRRGRGKSRIGG